MMAVYGRVPREGDVVHVSAHRLTDLSAELASVGERGVAFPVSQGRGDQVKTGSGPDTPETLGRKARETYVPDLHIDRIKIDEGFSMNVNCAALRSCLPELGSP
jgi:error-prone DNA polymerase